MIKGTINKTRCDARCWKAKGTACHCACGGRAHGSLHQKPAFEHADIAELMGTVILAVGLEDENEVSGERIAAIDIIRIKETACSK